MQLAGYLTQEENVTYICALDATEEENLDHCNRTVDAILVGIVELSVPTVSSNSIICAQKISTSIKEFTSSYPPTRNARLTLWIQDGPKDGDDHKRKAVDSIIENAEPSTVVGRLVLARW